MGISVEMILEKYYHIDNESEGKQFITTEPTRIRTKDGRTHNGNLLYTIRPIQDAIDYFHERQGLNR